MPPDAVPAERPQNPTPGPTGAGGEPGAGEIDAAVVDPPPFVPPEPTFNLPTDCADKVIDPGPALIRRMTRLEYNNTVRDLLHDSVTPADAFLPEEEFLGFDNNASALQIS